MVVYGGLRGLLEVCYGGVSPVTGSDTISEVEPERIVGEMKCVK